MNIPPTAPRTDADLIFSYSRAQAIADGVLVDASTGPLGQISRQTYKYPIAMTAEVFFIIEQAADNPLLHNDLTGIWNDIMWMSLRYIVARPDPATVLFQVKITGIEDREIFTFKLVVGPGDNAEPVITLMLPDQD